MSRTGTLLTSAFFVCACEAPGLKSIRPPSTTTEASSTTDDTATDTSIMTTTEDPQASDGSQSGDHSGSSSTTTGTTGSTGTTTGTTTGSEPVCGDGVVDGDEECDDANGIDVDRCSKCTKNRWIFASAALHNDGTLGGVEGADSLCRQYALQSGKADDSWKTFIAWISDADHDVRDRLYPGRGRYVRTDGVIVAESVERFFSGSIAAPINVDEHGNQDIGGAALTGTKPDGTAAPGTHCDNWTSNKISDLSAYTGGSSSVTASWTMYPDPPGPCTVLNARLYCIEGK